MARGSTQVNRRPGLRIWLRCPTVLSTTGRLMLISLCWTIRMRLIHLIQSKRRSRRRRFWSICWWVTTWAFATCTSSQASTGTTAPTTETTKTQWPATRKPSKTNSWKCKLASMRPKKLPRKGDNKKQRTNSRERQARGWLYRRIQLLILKIIHWEEVAPGVKQSTPPLDLRRPSQSNPTKSTRTSEMWKNWNGSCTKDGSLRSSSSLTWTMSFRVRWTVSFIFMNCTAWRINLTVRHSICIKKVSTRLCTRANISFWHLAEKRDRLSFGIRSF